MNNIEQFLLNYSNIKTENIFARNTSAVLVANTPCNLSCPYCYANNCTNQEQIKFLPEKLEPILNKFSNVTNENIQIWAGEPLYSKDLFVEICNFINRVLPNHNIIIYTNGTLLDDWWADFFKDHKVCIKLSHDGPGQKYRGFNYLESDSHVKAIKKIYENGNLCGVNTTIHKYNCSFTDIITYFKNFENKTGVELNTQSRCLVGLNLAHKIIYDFDYTNNDLFQYIIDTYTFLFKSLLNKDLSYVMKYFPPDTIMDTLPIFMKILGMPVLTSNDCFKKSITIDGNPYCVYGAYSKDLPEICYTNHSSIKTPSKCLACTIYDTCPHKTCFRISAKEESCQKTIKRYNVIYNALQTFINNINKNNILKLPEGN